MIINFLYRIFIEYNILSKIQTESRRLICSSDNYNK